MMTLTVCAILTKVLV